jgi:hypothetical protein
MDGYQESLVSLDALPFLIPLQLVAFWGLLVAITAAHNVKVLVYGYQSINTNFTMVPLKFDGGLSMSIMRKKQFFYKP